MTTSVETKVEGSGSDSAPDVTADAVVSIPSQRGGGDEKSAPDVDGQGCLYCGRSGLRMEDDPDNPGRRRCRLVNDNYEEACSRFKPHCPAWCAKDHWASHFRPPTDTGYEHRSDPIGMAFPDPEWDSFDTTVVMATIQAEEANGKVGEVQVWLGDIPMNPAQTKAFATMMDTVAMLAGLSPDGVSRIKGRGGFEYQNCSQMRTLSWRH
jgi:hypothetical protein